MLLSIEGEQLALKLKAHKFLPSHSYYQTTSAYQRTLYRTQPDKIRPYFLGDALGCELPACRLQTGAVAIDTREMFDSLIMLYFVM